MRLPWQTSDLHPHALGLTEDALCDGFADALAHDLSILNPSSFIERYSCVFPSGAQDAALKAAGFYAVRLTRVFDLPVSMADHAALADDLPAHVAPHWFRPGERGPWAGWLSAQWRHYVAIHPSNPPRPPPIGLRAVFAGKDLVDGFALRDGPQGRVRAFASLRDGHTIGWVGGPRDVLPLVLGACLRRAAACGWTKASVEVPDDDADLWVLMDALGIAPARTFVTWQLERNPAKRPH